MIKFLFFCLIFATGNCFAQQDYIITKADDTLTGKVTRGNFNRNHITLKNDIGRKKIHLREIKEWKNGDFPVIVLPGTAGKREYWLELLLVSGGRKRLFRDLHHISGINIYYTEFNGKYIQLTKHNIENYLWNELLQCKLFSEEYGNQNKTQLEKIQLKLEEIFHNYNDLCPPVQE